MSFWINDAMAATPVSSGMQSDGTFSMVMIAVIFVMFYVMLIRPQNKRAKEHKALIEKLKIGDEIVTTGGLLGKIASVDETYLKLSIAEGVVVTIQRNAVGTVLPKGSLKSI